MNLPKQISAQQYSDQMLAVMERAEIRCVGSGDQGFPVQFEGAPKTCRFDQYDNRAQIMCDLTKFNSLAGADQYVLVHHEYAGLAGVEVPKGSDSNYEVSNQISEYLVKQVVEKLAVKPRPQTLSECLMGARVGTKCTNSLGLVYERVSWKNFGEAWRGPDGMIWGDVVGVGMDIQPNAAKICKNLGGKLPSYDDFSRGSANGFSEVLTNMIIYKYGSCFWSSTTYDSAGTGYLYSRWKGNLYKASLGEYCSIRCVAR